MNSQKIYVGKLGRSVGLKGEIKIFIESDFPEQFQKGFEVLCSKGELLRVESINFSNNTVKFTQINTVQEAKKLTNQFLYTTKDQSYQKCLLNKGEYFWFDIVECEVHDSSCFLGSVKEIFRYPLGDYLEVCTADDLIQKGMSKTFLIPYESDYIVSVDIQSKKIYTDNAIEILENS